MDHVPQNQWYVIALTREITERPIARTVCGEHIVCYRVEDGTAVALSDRCPHRRYPLSLGRVDGETLICGYHGFHFDSTGHCVAVPGQGRVPARADVAKYHLVEQGLWTWVWIGDEEPSSRLPNPTPWIEGAEGWRSVTGMAPLDCRHSLLVDNLLDLSHETYLHGGYIGTPEVATTPTTTRIERDRNLVSVSRHMESVACPPFYERTTGLSSPVDRWQDIEYFAPAYYQLHVRIAPAGSVPSADGSDPDGFHLKILYGLTPSTPTTTYDFWAVCRDFAIADPAVDDALDAMQRNIVIEDVNALNVLERRISADDDPFEVVVGIDRGALSARRMIRALSGDHDVDLDNADDGEANSATRAHDVIGQMAPSLEPGSVSGH